MKAPGLRQDEMRFTILEDGTISCETDAVSGVNHMSADSLLASVKKLAGGQATKVSRQRGKQEHTHHGDVLKQSQ